MNQVEIVDMIARHTREVIPGLDDHQFLFEDSLRSLGANSVDRADIIMKTLESLSLNISLVEMAKAENIGQLAEIMKQRL